MISAAVAAGRNASTYISDSATLKSKLETVIRELLAELEEELSGDALVDYASSAEALKQELLAKESPNPSLFKKLITSLSFLDNANGSVDLMAKVWPHNYSLIQLANNLGGGVSG